MSSPEFSASVGEDDRTSRRAAFAAEITARTGIDEIQANDHATDCLHRLRAAGPYAARR